MVLHIHLPHLRVDWSATQLNINLVLLLLLSFSSSLLSSTCQELPCSFRTADQLHFVSTVSSASSPSSSSASSPSHAHLPALSIAIGAISCLAVACILLAAALSFLCRRWRQRNGAAIQVRLPSFNIYTPSDANAAPPIRRFTAKELSICTSNFCYRLGRQPNSSVFKGWIEGTPVAVKRVDAKRGGQDGFLASVYQACCVQHTNLVRLLGFCLEKTEMLLVYEYLEAGSLDVVLLKKAEALDWDTRYSIAMKVAQTLLFLHEECGECLVHGNVKLENIMLGEDWSPKLADFGLADLCVRDKIAALRQAKSHDRSPGLANGSVSSAWLSGLRASAATDVYGFGLVLLSLILGRGNIVDALAASNDPIFLEWVYLQAKQGMYEDALDGRLLLEANSSEVRVALQLAFRCMQDDPAARPSMQRVWQVLRDREELGLPPIASLGLGCHTSSETDRDSEHSAEHVLVLDIEREREGAGAVEGNGEIEPCYQVFSMRFHKRSASSFSSMRSA
ncbi:hypothetical protein KP509_01G089400 [Ceratopteris richardii]|uniref:Protein kinase domain-containing protein n=1 Tax=Ceratopteris richardii TaxID=49495 RepID=A0A8T2VIJ5_CERRI|nr:hypothetical protein KP509_01G089400 [Ceratopteris richardii]